MALSYIQMPVDGAGKQVQAWVNALGPGNLYTEAVTITDSSGIEKATIANPLRIDPTGTTVQPVLDAATSATGSGVPSDASYQGLNVSGTLRGITGVNPTGAVYAAQMDLSSVGGTSLALGQALAASSIPVVLPSGTNVPVTGTLTAVTSITNPVTVVGDAASGAAVAGNPVLIAGQDGADARTLLTSNTGQLHIIADSGTITTVSTVTAVTAITNALPAGSNTIGKVDILGNAGVVLDAVLGATKPANVLQVGGNDGTNAYAVPLASGGGSVVVSGSVTIAANSSVNLAQVNGVTTLTGAGASGTGAQRVTVSQDITTIAGSAPGTAGSASTNVLTVQGIASMTKLLVTPDSVALPANQSVNVSQLNGTTTDTNSGAKSAGTLRVVIATDQPQLTNKLLVTPDANSAINVAQINGNTTLTGNGVTGTGSQRVTIASDNTAFSVNATIVPATSGGASVYHVVSAASTNAANIKASAGQLYGVSIYNATTYPVYAKLYNTAGTPTVGTGVIQTFGCQAGTQTQIPITQGIPYATGIGISITKGIADSDATAVAANDCVVEVYYK